MEFSVGHLAALTRLSLDEEEKKRLESDLAGILAYVDQLREVDTDDGEEVTRVRLNSLARQVAPEINRLREDVLPSSSGDEPAKEVAILRSGFPEEEEGYLRVPLVINKK